MKISSVSKKVLASALSAAMVVAFAPTVAFAAAVTTDVAVANADDAGMAARGYVAKYYNPAAVIETSVQGSTTTETKAPGYTYLNKDAFVAQIAAGNAGLVMIKDINDGLAVNANLAANAAIDMNGHTITNDADGYYAGDNDGTADETPTSNAPAISITDSDVSDGNTYKVSFKNGTVKALTLADSYGEDKDMKNKAIDATTVDIALEAVTTESDLEAVDAKNVTLKGGTYGIIKTVGNVTVSKTVATKQIAGTVSVLADSALTVEATELTNADITGISTGLTVAKNASATVTAIAKGGDATAIAGGVTATADGAVVKAVAKASAATKDAYAVKGAVAVTGKGASLNAQATSADMAYGIKATAASQNVTINAGTIAADGETAAKSYAIDITNGGGDGVMTIAGGSYAGKLAAKATKDVTAGTFSENPTAFVDTDTYDVSKVDGQYVVQQYTGFNVYTNANADLATFLEASLEAMAKGQTVKGIQLAEGVTQADLLAKGKELSSKAGADRLSIIATYKTYTEKTATDAQKAAKAALDEAIKADLSKTDDGVFQTLTVTIQYTDPKKIDPVVMATVTELGTIPSGLSTRDAVLSNGNYATTDMSGFTAWGYVDGAAVKTAWKDLNKDGKITAADLTTGATIEYNAIPTVIAVSAQDDEALKNVVIKGEDTPAVEKATQGIDVSKKSMTVKLGKATKTSKSKTFSMGASAETKLTTSKKSGSKYITVKGQKVTLKKGVKKGTYTAKVSLKAASSDAYLAAAKTITVKFVVKK